jgi:voltage-gated potassium channel
MVDLLSILPSYLTLLVPGMHTFMIVRGLRLIRVFRIFKLDAFIEQGNLILNALNDSRRKLTIFAMTILIYI